MGICVITDDGDNRIRVHCHGDAARDGVALGCGAEEGCIAPQPGQTRRYFDGDLAAWRAAMSAAGVTDGKFWEWAWDGESFSSLGPLP